MRIQVCKLLQFEDDPLWTITHYDITCHLHCVRVGKDQIPFHLDI